ncbi:superoxide dismutase [Mycobacterium xenopi 4042]|uniref:Superoxide dismutase n=1 Tax=Mycobacterium xenopi 4042 TaxID=1299334 RepID=X8CNH7_MYCXE|nr:superoxide dismutase [Mycobacterium xenopi 3993]EUA56785.1 superoxide dismutase [Mycobacterium xenopi 4042]
MAEYTLPDLDWDYGALEPHISGQINELHHSKHHATYVKGANDALAKLEEARAKDDHSAIVGHEKALAFNLAGHVNHCLWWKNLSPNGGDKPTGELAAAIDDAFGSFDKFRAQFTAAATTVQGSGWAALGWDSLGGKLLVFQVYDHQSNFPLGIVPCWCSTCGSTPSTCSTRMSRLTSPKHSGTWSTGRTSRSGMRPRPRKPRV